MTQTKHAACNAKRDTHRVPNRENAKNKFASECHERAITATLSDENDVTIFRRYCLSSDETFETIKEIRDILVKNNKRVFIIMIKSEEERKMCRKFAASPTQIITQFLKSVGTIQQSAHVVTIVTKNIVADVEIARNAIPSDGLIEITADDLRFRSPRELINDGDDALALLVQHVLVLFIQRFSGWRDCALLCDEPTMRDILASLDALSLGTFDVDESIPIEWKAAEWHDIAETRFDFCACDIANIRRYETVLSCNLPFLNPEVNSILESLMQKYIDYETIWREACATSNPPIYFDRLKDKNMLELEKLDKQLDVRVLIEARNAGVPLSDLFPETRKG